MGLPCNTGHSYSTKNIFSVLSPLKEEKYFACKGIAVIDVGKAMSEDLSTKGTVQCCVFYVRWNFSVDFWGVRSGPRILYLLIHRSAHSKSICSEQFNSYQHKCFKKCLINYICYFNWLRVFGRIEKQSFHMPGIVSGQSYKRLTKPLGFSFWLSGLLLSLANLQLRSHSSIRTSDGWVWMHLSCFKTLPSLDAFLTFRSFCPKLVPSTLTEQSVHPCFDSPNTASSCWQC